MTENLSLAVSSNSEVTKGCQFVQWDKGLFVHRDIRTLHPNHLNTKHLTHEDEKVLRFYRDSMAYYIPWTHWYHYYTGMTAVQPQRKDDIPHMVDSDGCRANAVHRPN